MVLHKLYIRQDRILVGLHSYVTFEKRMDHIIYECRICKIAGLEFRTRVRSDIIGHLGRWHKLSIEVIEGRRKRRRGTNFYHRGPVRTIV